MPGERLKKEFFTRDVLLVAPELIGKRLVRCLPDGSRSEHLIIETEAYRGTEDKACHASKGRTRRTEVMYQEGGVLYLYLIYGMYWMLNVVTSLRGVPQAVLIRGLSTVTGPGRLSRELDLDKSFYGEDLMTSARIWIEENDRHYGYTKHPRIGIDYAGEEWASKPWRFMIKDGWNHKL